MQDAKSDISKESTKQKLTLGIDKNVIEKAKAAGINISAITENLLRTMTYEPKNDYGGNTRHDVARAYEELFHEAWKLLIQYDQTGSFDVVVGNWQYDWENKAKTVICFNSQRGLAICYDGDPWRSIIEPDVPVDKILEALYDLDKILENLIEALIQAAENNKAIITELKFAMRIIKALSDSKEEGEEHKK